MLPAICLVILALGLGKTNALLAELATMHWQDPSALKPVQRDGMLIRKDENVYHVNLGVHHAPVAFAIPALVAGS